jgi:hypothetical protein
MLSAVGQNFIAGLTPLYPDLGDKFRSKAPGTPAQIAANQVSIGGQIYTVTRDTEAEVVAARIKQREAQLGRKLDAGETQTIKDAIHILAQSASTGEAPAQVAPVKQFGSLSDYLGIIKEGSRRSVQSSLNLAQAAAGAPLDILNEIPAKLTNAITLLGGLYIVLQLIKRK